MADEKRVVSGGSGIPGSEAGHDSIFRSVRDDSSFVAGSDDLNNDVTAANAREARKRANHYLLRWIDRWIELLWDEAAVRPTRDEPVARRGRLRGHLGVEARWAK